MSNFEFYPIKRLMVEGWPKVNMVNSDRKGASYVLSDWETTLTLDVDRHYKVKAIKREWPAKGWTRSLKLAVHKWLLIDWRLATLWEDNNETSSI